MKYQIWKKGTRVYNGIYNHKLIKTYKNEEAYKNALKNKKIYREGVSYFYKYAIIE